MYFHQIKSVEFVYDGQEKNIFCLHSVHVFEIARNVHDLRSFEKEQIFYSSRRRACPNTSNTSKWLQLDRDTYVD